jgi:hypothetical protein
LFPWSPPQSGNIPVEDPVLLTSGAKLYRPQRAGELIRINQMTTPGQDIYPKTPGNMKSSVAIGSPGINDVCSTALPANPGLPAPVAHYGQPNQLTLLSTR